VNLMLDTNALSSFAEGGPEVTARISESQVVAIPVIVLGEYRFGILQSRRRSEHEAWLADKLPLFIRLDVDEGTASHYAEIRLELKRQGTPIPVNDLWIAALCRQHGFDILSRDSHFDRVAGLRRIFW
jgi:predicted nucleic acid-binding protein